MGSCFSKKTAICSSSTTVIPDPPDQIKPSPQPPKVAEKKKPEEETVKKEIFLIKHRRSHDSDRKSEEEKPKSDQKTPTGSNPTSEAADFAASNLPNGGIVVRTSSCSKEEIDAILIQCGRLSRSSSTGKAAAAGGGGGRKYSGSKRSYDFDQENSTEDDVIGGGGGDEVVAAAERIHRHRHRQSSTSSGRRRTPSRERDQQQQRSGSRERGGSSGGGGGGRRVSRSPVRRSESPITGSSSGNTNPNTNTTRPGKMVSVPATVMDKSGNGAEPPSATGIKRISVRRNAGGEAGGGRSGASPRRSRSPARANNVRVSNENQNSLANQQPPSLSRSNSRKAEQSPYRRNPLGEIDQNCIGFEVNNNHKGSNNVQSQAPIQKPITENVKSNNKTNHGVKAKEQKMEEEEGGKGLQPNTGNVSVTVVNETLKPQTITRTRSSRLSRDLDLNLNPTDTLLNPTPSYTALLLEDIQNFHQKTAAPASSLSPLPCLTRACSILEAVADLNSTTVSSLSGGEQLGKKRFTSKEPFVESEVVGCDDLMEPSFHKYVTVSRGGGGGDMEEVESSGSNSFVAGGGQQWLSSSSWEPNSADSTGTSSRVSEKKREDVHQRVGIGRNRIGSSRGLQSTPTLTAAST